MEANSTTTWRGDLPEWPDYENDLSFRHWINMRGTHPDYTWRWWKHFELPKLLGREVAA